MTEDYPSTPSLATSEDTSFSSDIPLMQPLSPPHPTSLIAKEKQPPTTGVTVLLPLSTLDNRRYFSGLSYASMQGLTEALSHPTVLKCILSYVSWREFHAITRACRSLRNLFCRQDVKDVVFSRFVPGYRVTSLYTEQEQIPVTLPDLEALMLLQTLPLHRYPMHAVYLVSTPNGIPPSAHVLTKRLVRFAQIHSLFVLLLRSRVPQWPIGLDMDDLVRHTNPTPSTLRELTFPAPLSYFSSSKQKTLPPTPLSSKQLKKRSNTKRRPASEESPTPLSRADDSKRRFSIFGRSGERIPLPAPQSVPSSLRYYSSHRTRHAMNTSDDEFGTTFNRDSRSLTDDLAPPRYPFASRNSSSPSSSVGSLSRSTTSPVQSALSPHELSNATMPRRAPVLRVFVPCSTLTSTGVLAEVEGQIKAAGLWKYLRVGDVVCNLGYVPEDSSNMRGWLVYTGDALCPFFPPEPPPVHDMTSLPSPMYFSHLLSPSENLRCILDLPQGVQMVLNLASLSTNVPSPHSPTGHARVKRFAWLGRITILEDETEALGLGEGWAGEWVLEADGTKEGRQILVDALKETTHRLVHRAWEIISEKSGSGKLWLRLIPERVEQWESENSSVGHTSTASAR